MSFARMEAPSAFRAMSFQDIASMLAQTLGQEKSTEVVGVAAATLGYRGPLLTREEATTLLDHLARVAGLIGIAARFAQRRAQAAEDREPPSSVRVADRSSPVPESASGIRAEIVALLSPSLGAEKAEEEVAGASRRLGVAGRLTASQATTLLEELAKTPGPIGTTARFAKARFLLRKA